MALYKAAAIWRENSGLNNFQLVRVLLRDQAIYFLACVYFAHIVSSQITTFILQTGLHQHLGHYIQLRPGESIGVWYSWLCRKPSNSLVPRGPPPFQHERSRREGPEPGDKLQIKINREWHWLCGASSRCGEWATGWSSRARGNWVGGSLLR